MVARIGWSRNQLLVAFSLYCQMPFGKMHSRNPEIIKYAVLIGRTPSALAMKLTNIASLDPSITSTGRRGLEGASAADKAMWQEMQDDWNSFAIEAQQAAMVFGETADSSTEVEGDFPSNEVVDYTGREKVTSTMVRVGQNFFRRSVLSAYNYHCCISGLAIPQLLVASHIIPWRVDYANRLNPRNGLCLSVLHDKAFDVGIITIAEDMTVKVSKNRQKEQVIFLILRYLHMMGRGWYCRRNSVLARSFLHITGNIFSRGKTIK